jgi:DNA-binding XRE family transcriptional regulator
VVFINHQAQAARVAAITVTTGKSRGRPRGSTSFDGVAAAAFGAAVRERRVAAALSQEALASRADIERAHMGKIERGQHMPTLAAILRIARALGCTGSELVAMAERALPAGYNAPST